MVMTETETFDRIKITSSSSADDALGNTYFSVHLPGLPGFPGHQGTRLTDFSTRTDQHSALEGPPSGVLCASPVVRCPVNCPPWPGLLSSVPRLHLITSLSPDSKPCSPEVRLICFCLSDGCPLSPDSCRLGNDSFMYSSWLFWLLQAGG